MGDKKWPLPQDSGSNRSGFMEHRSGHSGGRAPDRSGMNDQGLSDALDIGVQNAHEKIEDVTEHQTWDLDIESRDTTD